MTWKSIVAELQALGLSQPQIANACGCRQGTISAIATGKTAEPKFGLGKKLLELLADKRAAGKPDTTRQPSAITAGTGALAGEA
jgi:transcriptional regulator with XRE-family HTH domain